MEDEIKDVDKDVAFIIELIGGFFGFLGIGYMYSGLIKDGVIRLVIWFFIISFGWAVAGILTMFLIGCCMMPFLIIAQIAVPIWSAFSIRTMIEEADLNKKKLKKKRSKKKKGDDKEMEKLKAEIKEEVIRELEMSKEDDQK